MKENTKENIWGLIVVIIGMALIISVLFLVMNKQGKVYKQFVYHECCNDNPCTDTYYVAENNTCHLTLCENLLFKNKSECVYQGRYPEIDIIN
jgi:hypothetical protein